MKYVNKIKIKLKSGEEFEFEVGKKTDLIDFWNEDAIVQAISYRSIVESSLSNIEIKAWPDNLVGSGSSLNISKNDIEYFSYIYVLGPDPNE